MKKFTITIEETIAQNFEIVAETAEEAMKIAEEKYHNLEMVLEPGEVTVKQTAITKPNNEVTEWTEF